MPSRNEAPGARLLSSWNRLSRLPFGRWIFNRMLGRMVPYTGALGARVESLEAGRSVVTLADRRASQTLNVPEGQPFDCDAPHFSVQWAGDLDGDGRLDLVTTFSPKYSWYPRRLYLSSAARAGELVGLVAVLDLAAA